MKIDIAIAGAGIIGFFSALELRKKFPQSVIAVFEQEKFFADHTTGRNSGVLHAGIYYENKSKKHELCIEGNLLWKEIILQNNLNFLDCGKFIFSQHQSTANLLEEVLRKAETNGVPGIRRASKKELERINKDIHAEDAIYSPSTGVLDVSSTMAFLVREAEKNDIYLLKESRITSLKRESDHFEFVVNEEIIQCDLFINCAGLDAIDLRRQLDLVELENSYVKGNYISTQQKLEYNVLYYPLPPIDLKGLGVHSTIDFNNRVKFGPNTEDVSEINYKETQDAKGEMISAILSTFKDIDPSKLYWDYCGIRPKIKLTQTGKIHTDFWIKNPIKGYFELLGIESPGLTAAPAIARHLTNLI